MLPIYTANDSSASPRYPIMPPARLKAGCAPSPLSAAQMELASANAYDERPSKAMKVGKVKQSFSAACKASVGILAIGIASAAWAQEPAPKALDMRAPAASADDIVVTARRDAERLQDVPVSVQVLTGDRLAKLAITSTEEISKLTPGLTLSAGSSNNSITLRGVTWKPGSGTPATPIYLNEAPFDPGTTIQSLFDIGQIEVLRGPQGTSRGAPSISGAITITTRKPDLNEFGGYVRGQYGEGDHIVANGAVNVPIVKGALAVRFAANYEKSDGDRVRSVNSLVEPYFRDRTYRGTVLFEPNDDISISAMIQRREELRRFYTQVVGNGSPGVPALGIPAGFNGPPLGVNDRRSVQDLPGVVKGTTDLITINASWRVFGHKLSYNFGSQDGPKGSFDLAANDPLNVLPGFEPYGRTDRGIRGGYFRTNEIRISSEPDPDRPFDYDIGWFAKHSDGALGVNSQVYYLPRTLGGAFGPIGTPPGTFRTPDRRYVLVAETLVSLPQKFDSFYGNVRFHLSENTELAGGLAIVRDRRTALLDVRTLPTLAVAAPLSALQGAPCSAVGLIPSNYTGFCDVQIPAGVGNSLQVYDNKDTDALYNFSFSYKFSDAVLVYATTGSSFRTGLPAIGNDGLPPAVANPEPEKARSYEVGVKTTLARGFTANLSLYQLDYKGQLTTFEGIPYFNSISGAVANTSLAFYRNVDSRVRGLEIELTAQPIDNLMLGANIAYAKIKSRGGIVPVPNGPPITAANPINTGPIPSGRTLNQTPPLQVTVNGSYDLPVNDTFAGYFRFNASYVGKNPNFGNFPDAAGNFRKAPAFTIVDLFAGVTGGDGAWDLGIYAKNVFDKNVELGRVATPNIVYAPHGPGGYDAIRTNLPREVGVSLRYAFGSR